jgi:hypothetical protein
VRVSFKARGRGVVKFTAHPKKHKTPSHLKKFLFKPGAKRTKACLKKAHAVLRKRGWRI